MCRRFIPIMIGLAACQAAPVQAQAADSRPDECAVVYELAKRAYERVRQARLRADEARALEQAEGFWDIAELGSRCASIRPLAAELDRTRLSKQAVLASRNTAKAGSRQGSSGGVTQGSATSAGNNNDLPASKRSDKKDFAPTRALQRWEGTTIGGIVGTLHGHASGAGSATGAGADTAGALANSTVANIELVPGKAEDAGSAGTVAGTATGSSTENRVYRITLRMDDGTTQVITQDATPTFRVGDRVKSSGSVIER